MKTLVSLFLLLFCTLCFAQKIKDQDVPTEVKSAFGVNFKEVKKAHWQKEDNGNYEAEFKLHGKEMSATFTADGTLLETETEIKINELPSYVFNYIAKNYPGYKVQEAAVIIDVAGVKKFEAEIKNKKEGKEMDLFFDEKGDFLSKKI